MSCSGPMKSDLMESATCFMNLSEVNMNKEGDFTQLSG